MTKTFLLSCASAALATVTAAGAEDLEPVDQAALNALLEQDSAAAFEFAFEAGDELTEADFTSAHGVGANVGEGRRFSRFPRADLTGERDWARHWPRREGGPNASSCISCHNAPGPNGSGGISSNVLVDPDHTGEARYFLERNTTHLFALATPQKLAEEMSRELRARRSAIRERACAEGMAEGALVAKGVGFGTLAATRVTQTPCAVRFDNSRIEGIEHDLIVRPFGWKGNHATIRSFTRGAAHNELGMQAVELTGDEDGDFDGVTGELTVGDLTALTAYMAGLERPVSTVELSDLGLVPLTGRELALIEAGEDFFAEAGCARCHTPQMRIEEPVFREPSPTPGYFDATFPSGEDPSDHALLADLALWFDMTEDQPNNRIETGDGDVVHLGALPEAGDGAAIARWYTDFKRHDMGPALADPADPLGIGAAIWPTRSLAGVGSTGPWLHDGRATTLEEAIMAHGGAGAKSRNAFAALSPDEQGALIAFLESLVIYTHEADEH